MKFTIFVTDTDAAAIVTAAAAAVFGGNNGGCLEDAIYFILPDGQEVQLVEAEGQQRCSSEDRWTTTAPTTYTSVRAEAMNSTLTLSREGEAWRLCFEGLRGSLMWHWGSVKTLLQVAEAQGARVEDYETSIPGMLPWEGLADWYRRVTGAAEGPNPFRADTGPHTGAYCLSREAEAEDEAQKRFNTRFFAAIQQMAAKGKLNAQNLRVHARLIAADLRRLHKLAA